MSTDHHIQLPKAFWGLKIAQLVIAVLVLALACYEIAIIAFSSTGYIVFTSVFTIGILIYYFIAVHSQHHAYNWIALVVLESIALLFWLVVWAIIAAAIGYIVYYYDNYGKRSLTKRLTYGEVQAYGAIGYVILALGLIEWVLYCVTLGFLAAGIHKHRQAGRPMIAGGHSSSSSWNNAPKEEKHDMQPMPAQQQYYAPDQQQQQQQQGTYNGGFNAAEAPGNRY